MKYNEEMKKRIVLGYDNYLGTLKEYCDEQSISRASFYKWQSIYKEKETEIIDITDSIINEPKKNKNLRLIINDVEIVLSNAYAEDLLIRVVRSLKKYDRFNND